MADLIDRDAALKKIDTIRKAYMLHEPAGMGGMSAICICRDAVKEVLAVNRWISCSERLPEIFYYVIVAGSDGIGIARYNGALFADDSGATYPISAITHWMPLPEPPETE